MRFMPAILDALLADHATDIVMFDVPPHYEGVSGIEASRRSRAAASISAWFTLQPRLTMAAVRGRASITTGRASSTS